MVEVNKEEFLKNFREQEQRAYKIIKILKTRSNAKNNNYILKKKIIIDYNLPRTVIEIQELPELKITSNNQDSDDEYYRVIDIDNIEVQM